MNFKIFGKKTDAIFDYWSLAHIALHFFITKIFLINYPVYTGFFITLAIGIIWELIESDFEERHHSFKKYFQKNESLLNRYLGDLISNAIGFLLGYYIF